MDVTTVPNTHGVGKVGDQDGTVLGGLCPGAWLAWIPVPHLKKRAARSLPHATEFGDEAAGCWLLAAHRVRVWRLLRRRIGSSGQIIYCSTRQVGRELGAVECSYCTKYCIKTG